MFGIETLDQCAKDEKVFDNTSLKMFIVAVNDTPDRTKWETMLPDFTEVATKIKNYSNLWKLHDTEYKDGEFSATYSAKRTPFTIRLSVVPEQGIVDMCLYLNNECLSGYKALVAEHKKNEFTPFVNEMGLRYPKIYLYGDAGLTVDGEAARLFRMYVKTAHPIKKAVFDFAKENNIIFGW